MGAVYIVRINLSAIKDEPFVGGLSARADKTEKQIVAKDKEIIDGMDL